MVQLTTIVGALALAQSTLAFPALSLEATKQLAGPSPSLKTKRQSFNAAQQLISVSGAHAFVPPGSGDQRGPCPGLNALANHNYLPHNGVATITQFISATNQVYGMGLDLATFLAVYGAVMDGDLLSWSIGGPTGEALPLGLLSQPQGISFSHNKYETDASPTRGDLYEYGNAYLVQLSQFQDLYNRQSSVSDADANYDLAVLEQFRADRIAQSKANNPYFFSGPFVGVAVMAAAYSFIYRFMANKSAEYPEGRLDKTVLKSFFSITGPDDALVYTPGHEQIPTNWYTRASGDEYTIPYLTGDFLSAAAQHPEFLEVGGNTGKVNSFTGVDVSNISGGVYNLQTLTQGDNLLCFAAQAALQQAPDFLSGLLNDISGAVNQIQSAAGFLGNCPAVGNFDFSSFQQFPGFTRSV